jgi:hypothetical protein
MVERVKKYTSYLGHSLMMKTSVDMFDHELLKKTKTLLNRIVFLVSKDIIKFLISIYNFNKLSCNKSLIHLTSKLMAKSGLTSSGTMTHFKAPLTSSLDKQVKMQAFFF